MNKEKFQNGFTLIELLVVIAIIAILVLIGVPRYISMTKTATVTTFEANHRMLIHCLALYQTDSKGKPSQISDLESYLSKQNGSSDIQGQPKNAGYEIEFTTLKSTLAGGKSLVIGRTLMSGGAIEGDDYVIRYEFGD